jgi:hypothetical protein
MIDGSLSTPVDRTRTAVSPSRKVEDPSGDQTISKDRHFLELRLMHHYTSLTSTTLTIFSEHEEELKFIWTVAWPRKAFENEALLNAIYTITALHWSKLEPNNVEAAEAHKKYMGLTLSGHRDDVASLSEKNGDAVCLTSSLIRMCLFSEFSIRELEPYTPPFFWLKSTQASGQVWASSWNWIKDDRTSISSALFKSTPPLMAPALMFHANNRRDLEHLLECNREEDAEQLAIPEILKAYETTLSFIGGIKIAVAAEKSALVILRQLTSFPMFISRKFPPLVEQGQPRALVIMCHYFALLTKFKNMWFIGNTGEREIRAAEKFLPPQWQSSIEWPIQVLEDASALTPAEDSMQSPEYTELAVEIGQSSKGEEPAKFAVPFGYGYRGEG